MSKVISFDQPSANSFAVNYLVEKEEFSVIKEKAIEEALKDVEVEGFRKGKVPRDIALPKIEPAKIENLILQFTFQNNEKKAIEAGIEELKSKDRYHTSISLNVENGATKELEDGSFQFQIVFHLLPQIDISIIASIKLRHISEDEIVGRPNLKDFVKQEKDRIFCNYNRFEETDKASELFYQVITDLAGFDDKKEIFTEKNTKIILGLKLFLPEIEKNLTGVKKGAVIEFNVTFPESYPNLELAGKKVKVSATIKSVLAPQYVNLAEVFEKSKQATQIQEQFGSFENVDNVITEVYNQETTQRLQNIRQKEIVNKVMESVPDFDFNTDMLESEVKRIFENIQQRATDNKSKIGEEFVNAFPNSTPIKPDSMTEKDVKEELEKQVRNEFKWANILSYIYQTQITEKPKPEDFDQVKEAANKDPEKYGFSKETPKDQIENAVIDRVVRQIAFTWISNLLQNPKSDVTDVENSPKSSSKKPASAKKAKSSSKK